MIIVHVYIHVKFEFVEAFREATVKNTLSSIKETGIARFDLIQQQDDVTHFVLIEVYRDLEATIKHKETQHYQLWRDTVAEMMAEPRHSIKYSNVFPDDEKWRYPESNFSTID
jgi:quinol monooxygenase YgiN